MYTASNLSIRDNVWNHMAVTVDVANSNVKFYLNNSNVFTQSNVALTINSNVNTNLYIAHAEAESNAFKGLLDNVQLYDSAVSSYQMNDLATFPVLNLDMTPTDANLLIDNSAFQNSVTMSNNPSFTVYGYQPGNKAVVFDSSSNQALVVSASNVQNVNAKQMTLSMWVKPMEYMPAHTISSNKPLITKSDLFKLILNSNNAPILSIDHVQYTDVGIAENLIPIPGTIPAPGEISIPGTVPLPQVGGPQPPDLASLLDGFELVDEIYVPPTTIL